MTALEWLYDKWSNCTEWKWEEIKQWFEQAKQMEAEQSKIPELSDEEIKEKMFGGQFDDQDDDDLNMLEGAKWYREQLKQKKLQNTTK